MKENNLLNYTYNYRSPAKSVVEPVVSVLKPNEVREMDTKSVYLHGENRTAYLFAIHATSHMRGYTLPLQEKMHISSHSTPFRRRKCSGGLSSPPFEDAGNRISRFIEFYNNERLHSAIDYRTPREVYQECKEDIRGGLA